MSRRVFISRRLMQRTMWLPGHLAVGFLICLAALVIYVRKGGTMVLGLVFIAFFANLLDFLHVGGMRAFSHSFFGAAVLLCSVLAILIVTSGWRPWLATIATLAVISHLLADVFIGHIYPWYPWSMEIVQFNQFNTIFDIRVELGLCFIAFVPLLVLTLFWKRKFTIEGIARKELLSILFLLAPFLLFALAQMFYFIDLDIVQSTSVSAILLLLVFIGAVISSVWLLVRSLTGYFISS
jgi:hypothetical protein